MSDIDIVRAAIAAYKAGDRELATALYSPEFRFTSPQDDHIDRSSWFEVCFPTADRFVTHDLLEIVSTPTGVISLYEYELQNGKRYRNSELAVVRNGQIVEVQVYFGGKVN